MTETGNQKDDAYSKKRTAGIKLSNLDIERYKRKFNANTDSELLRIALEAETITTGHAGGLFGSGKKIQALNDQIAHLSQEKQRLQAEVNRLTQVNLGINEVNQRLSGDNNLLSKSLAQQKAEVGRLRASIRQRITLAVRRELLQLRNDFKRVNKPQSARIVWKALESYESRTLPVKPCGNGSGRSVSGTSNRVQAVKTTSTGG